MDKETVEREVEKLLVEMEATAKVEPMTIGQWADSTKYTVGAHELIVMPKVAEVPGTLRVVVKQRIGSVGYTMFEIILGAGVYRHQLRFLVTAMVSLSEMRYTVKG